MTDPIDTARQEGIALGLAMAKTAPRYSIYSGRRGIEEDQGGVWLCITDIPDPPIPPHVAAARVLLDAMEVMSKASWQAVAAALAACLRADIRPSTWHTEDEIMAALTAALEQIAKGEG
jgi:hypothetical protein